MSEDDRGGTVSLSAAGGRAWQVLGILLLAWALAWLVSRVSLAVTATLLAILLAATVAPLVDRLSRRGVSRQVAALAVTIGWFLALSLILGLIGWRFVAQVPELLDQIGQGIERLRQDYPSLPLQGDLQDRAMGALGDGSGAQQALTGLSTSIRFLSGFALATILSFFFVRDGERMWSSFLGLWRGESRDRVDRMGRAAHHTASQYVRGLAVVATADAVLSLIGLLLLGVPLASALAVLTFFAAFVPSIGAIVVGGLATLLAFTTGGPVLALVTAGLYTAIQQVDSSILQPWIMGHRLPLHPAAVLLALTVGALVAGVIGALLAVPLAAAAVAASRAYLGREPQPEGEAARGT